MDTLRSDQILGELRELWASLGKAAEPGDAQGVVRACSLTLIVFAEEADDPASIGGTLAELMREHPHRAIVVRVRPGPAALLEHRVLAQCWMPSAGRQQICCEQIEITAAEGSLADLPPVLLALRAPDLPVALWYRRFRSRINASARCPRRTLPSQSPRRLNRADYASAPGATSGMADAAAAFDAERIARRSRNRPRRVGE